MNSSALSSNPEHIAEQRLAQVESLGSLNGHIPIPVYHVCEPDSGVGVGDAKDPPAPDVPKAVLDAPNTHLDVGLLKPSEYDVSALPRKSRAPLVGITRQAPSTPRTRRQMSVSRSHGSPVAPSR